MGGDKFSRGEQLIPPKKGLMMCSPPNSWGEIISPRRGGERLRVTIPPLELGGVKSTKFWRSPPPAGGVQFCLGIPPLELGGVKSILAPYSPPPAGGKMEENETTLLQMIPPQDFGGERSPPSLGGA